MNKLIVSLILILLSILGAMISAAMGVTYAVTHIDDTAMRMLVDYPYPAIIAIVSFIISKIAEKMSE